MPTAVLPQVRERAPDPIPDGFQPPSYALTDFPQPPKMPKDALGADIVLLLDDHPEIASQIGPFDLKTMTVASKVELLARIKEMAGIRPIRTRRLGYVGPDIPAVKRR